MFVPTLVLGILWFYSVLWLYIKYTYEMSYTEQKIIWGRLLQNGNWLLILWTLSALISASAFISSWVMLVSVEADTAAQTEWTSSYVFILPCIIALQNAYNVMVGAWSRDSGKWWVCALLWAAVACYTWLWVACWTLFPSAIWLHVLNAVFWLHGLMWDAGIWFFSWISA